MKKAELKPIKSLKLWCYIAPDGFVQVRSIAHTKKICRETISSHESYTYLDYEKNGFELKRIIVSIKEVKATKQK